MDWIFWIGIIISLLVIFILFLVSCSYKQTFNEDTDYMNDVVLDNYLTFIVFKVGHSYWIYNNYGAIQSFNRKLDAIIYAKKLAKANKGIVNVNNSKIKFNYREN